MMQNPEGRMTRQFIFNERTTLVSPEFKYEIGGRSVFGPHMEGPNLEELVLDQLFSRIIVIQSTIMVFLADVLTYLQF